MHLVYMDDSRDNPTSCAFTAMLVPVVEWRETLEMIKLYRRQLRDSDGIFVRKEFHAWEFVSGRGRISRIPVPKGRRCQIYKETLALVTQLPGIQLINAYGRCNQQELLFERLLNRINVAMLKGNSHAIIICDPGKEKEFTRLVRKMSVHNPIPSRYEGWGPGHEATRNIPIERIVEDPVFRDSKTSYFIQLVDFCAYALLRRENPIPSKTKYGLDQAFDILRPVLNVDANKRDPEGIVRA